MAANPSPMNNGPSAKRWAALETKRHPFTQAAEGCAEVTIPSVFLPIGERESMNHAKIVARTPWQNTGARGVNNLASKLLLTLLPPNEAFFDFKVTEQKLLDRLEKDEILADEVKRALQKMQFRVLDEIENEGMRNDVFEMLRHLIVTGNYALFIPDDGPIRGYDLSCYVAKRNRRGDLLEAILREGVDEQTADDAVKKIIETKYPDRKQSKEQQQDRQPIFLFTHWKRTTNGRFKVHQEVCGEVVEGSEGDYTVEEAPLLVLRFRKVEGEDYGRGLCEEHIGDLKALNSLSRSIVQAAAASAKVLFGVDPAATTDPDELAALENLGFFQGKEGDVWALRVDKQGDLQVAQAAVAGLKEELAFVFMLNSAIQRNGERVTAEEIRYMAGELEDALGGVYSLLSQDFQLPFVRRVMFRLQKRGELPVLPQKAIKPVVVTGLEAIGRGHDLQRTRALITDLTGLMQVDKTGEVARRVKLSPLLDNLVQGHGIKLSVIKSEKEVAEEREAEQNAMAQQAVTGAAINALGKGAEKAAVNMADAAIPPDGQPPTGGQ